MSNISGLGGAFVFSENPGDLARWYERHLGLKFEGSEEFGAFYQVFHAPDPEDPEHRLDTTFAIMQARIALDRELPEQEPEQMYGDQPFMINLRVRDLERLLQELASYGIDVIGRQDESYGLFAWIRDADGNRIELYQPLQVEK